MLVIGSTERIDGTRKDLPKRLPERDAPEAFRKPEPIGRSKESRTDDCCKVINTLSHD
jgi:hypothetical protein